MASEMFTHWGREMDGPRLRLWIQHGDTLTERVTLDVTDLPSRADLLARVGPATRARMLWDAREVEKGNPSLDPSFPGYDLAPAG